MDTPFLRGMTRATELTKAGKLEEATALIQSLMQSQATTEDTAPFTDTDALEGTFSTLGDGVPEQVRATAAKSPLSARRGLGETLRNITSGGMPQHSILKPTPSKLRDGAQLLSLTYRGAQGVREYRLYLPANQPEAPMPLVVMLHGCTQTPEDFAAGTGMNTLAEEFGCVIAWPAQPQGANAQKCWNWYRPEDQNRERGEPALLAGIVREVLRDHPTDPARVYIAGLSAGGAAAAIMGAAYPELFTAVGVHSGLPVGAAQDIPSAFAAMRSGGQGKGRKMGVPVIVFHGLSDTTVHPDNGKAVAAQALQTWPELAQKRVSGISKGGYRYQQTRISTAQGHSMVEHWEIEGAGHAWAGGTTAGSFTDPKGPDASREMLRFFLQHERT